jgi:3-isopropylmalate/(R)-2-methylmalate dehydratase small subunit
MTMQAFRTLEAVAAPMPAANVDTDQVVPGRFIQKPRANDFGEFLFLDVRRDASGARRADFVLNKPEYAKAKIIVGGPNFGCGSSREHAVWALVDGGIRCVIAPSFGDIFHSNSIKNGLLPVVLPAAQVEALMKGLQAAPGATVRVDLQAQTVDGPGLPGASFSIDAFSRRLLLDGMDELDFTLGQLKAIEQYEQQRMNA